MEKLKRVARKILKVLNSKALVLIATGLFLFGGISTNKNLEAAQATDDSSYTFGIAYQYYMLSNARDVIKDQAEKQDVAAGLGNIGSGGVAGSFSFSDIVNGAPTDENGNSTKATAKKFAQTYATYAAFGYISNRVQGFNSIGPTATRIIVGLILTLPAILLDIMKLLEQAMVGLISKFNVITMLGNAFSDSQASSELATRLGITTQSIKDFMEVGMSVAVLIIAVTIVRMLISNKGVNQAAASKLKGRLITLIALPLVIIASSTLIQKTTEFAHENMNLGGGYARYLVDDRSWAFNFNFAPSGNSNSESDIGSSNGYVDLNFDPYVKADRITEINRYSSLNTAVMPNTSLILSYLKSESFSASDYINYKGSEESKSLYGSGATTVPTIGSYYDYANKLANMKNNDGLPRLIDNSKGYYGSTGNEFKVDNVNTVAGPFEKAIDDYRHEKSMLASNSATWRDRYIYGTKTGGKHMDDYYNEFPSYEQIYTKVGATTAGTVPSDSSMFLILSTQFDENGGKYYIQAPARGVSGKIAQFDSYRSDYYVVSMAGSAIFTPFALLAEPLITLVVLFATVEVIMTIGFLEMNLRPLRAFVKGIFIGDVEYPLAFGVYAIGISVTMIILWIMPWLLTTILSGIGSLVTTGLMLPEGLAPTSPQSSMALHGAKEIANGVFSFILLYLYLRNKKFRAALIGLIAMGWAWAEGMGDKLEGRAMGGGKSGNGNKIGQKVISREEKAHHKAEDLADAGALAAGGRYKDAWKKISAPLHDDSEKSKDGTNSTNGQRGIKPKVYSASEIKQMGEFDDLDNNLTKMQGDHNLDTRTAQDADVAQKALNKFRENPTQANFEEADEKFEILKEQMEDAGESPSDIKKFEKSRTQLHDLGKDMNVVQDDDEDITNSDEQKPKKSIFRRGRRATAPVEEVDDDQDLDSENPDVVKGGPRKNKFSRQKKANIEDLTEPEDQSTEETETVQTKPVQTKKSKFARQRKNISEVEDVTDNQEMVNQTQKVTRKTGKNRTVDDDLTRNEDFKVKTNVHRAISQNQVTKLTESFGTISTKPDIVKSVQRLEVAETPAQINKGLKQLKHSVSNLSETEKKQINNKQLNQQLRNIQKTKAKLKEAKLKEQEEK